MRRPLVMGNWKLNGSKEMVRTLLTELKNKLTDLQGCDVAVAPPYVYLNQAQQLLVDCQIKLGAQDVSQHSSGAFTGEVSSSMLQEMDARYIIIGHSERRTYHQESNELIAKKFAAVKEAGLIPVLCIGETEQENAAGLTEQVCASQLDVILQSLGVTAMTGSVVAYEPVWAIGTGKSATPEQAQAVHKFIRQHIAQHNTTIADQLIIQYGGSVNAENAAQLFSQPDIDGALVGGACLKADSFITIIKAAAIAKNNSL